jgi:site-specific recombinase XerD
VTTIVNRTVTPRRRPKADLRTREYLTPDEIETLIEALKGNRYGHRDATMIPVTLTEPGSPFATARFAKLVERAGLEAGFKFGTHPHVLRHSCGYKLANDGHDTRSVRAYLGHENIHHTVRYREMSSTRSKGFWRD